MTAATLAPSADFRWSEVAVSESFYYSNMSPQKPEFNRQSWSNLEGWVRRYVGDFREPVFRCHWRHTHR
jgi:endonuclease G